MFDALGLAADNRADVEGIGEAAGTGEAKVVDEDGAGGGGKAADEGKAVQQPSAMDIVAAAHEFLAHTPSYIALAQIDDLAGETVAVNLPGTDRERPNWRRKLAASLEALRVSMPRRSF
ncbi:MAG: 4-alpha-glucanotransferase [Alphaproteobacteria bacterium]